MAKGKVRFVIIMSRHVLTINISAAIITHGHFMDNISSITGLQKSGMTLSQGGRCHLI